MTPTSLLQKYKKLLIAAGVIIVLALGYSFFSGEEIPEGLTSQAAGGLAPEEGGDLIALLAELKSIELDTSILQNPTFLTLEDFSVSLTAEPVGRSNPFAPLGTSNTPVATTTPSDEE